jgi:hypothetical protein
LSSSFYYVYLDSCNEFVECSSDAKMRVACLDTEFVVSASEVLHEGPALPKLSQPARYNSPWWHALSGLGRWSVLAGHRFDPRARLVLFSRQARVWIAEQRHLQRRWVPGSRRCRAFPRVRSMCRLHRLLRELISGCWWRTSTGKWLFAIQRGGCSRNDSSVCSAEIGSSLFVSQTPGSWGWRRAHVYSERVPLPLRCSVPGADPARSRRAGYVLKRPKRSSKLLSSLVQQA